MQAKNSIAGMILAVLLLLTACYEKTRDYAPADDSYVPLRLEDGREFFTIFHSLNVITPSDVLDLSVGQAERTRLLRMKKKVTMADFDELKRRFEVFLVDYSKRDALYDFIAAHFGEIDSLGFVDIPDDLKGLTLKYLYQYGYHLVFSEFQGEYWIFLGTQKVL